MLSVVTRGDAQTKLRATAGHDISGIVFNEANGQPLDHADVTLLDSKTSSLVAEMFTDTEGHFDFQRLADGKYSLHAVHRGFITSAYDQHDELSTAIVTGSGLSSTGLKFALKPTAVIYGTITDDSGDPVQQARVQLYRQDDRSGTGKIVHASGSISDDLGNYEFPRLQAGNYYIAVIATPWYATHPQERPGQAGGSQEQHSSLDVAYATEFYADTNDPDASTPIPLRAGDRVPVNFMMHPVQAVHVTVELPGRERGEPFMMPQLRQNIFGSMEPAGMAGGIYSSLGNPSGPGQPSTMTLELTGVAPGHYEMELRAGRGEADHVSNVDITSGSTVINSSAGEAFTDVSCKVAMADGGSIPRGLRLRLLSQAGEEVGRWDTQQDGAFKITNVQPGTYDVSATGYAGTLAVTRLTATGATVDGHSVKVGSAPVTLSVTLAEGISDVSGFAKRDNSPAPGVMVVLIPANPNAGIELFRRDQTDSDGSFTLRQVIPGDYTLVAIDDGWVLDWAKHDVMAHYLAKGLRVRVPAHAKEVRLPEKLDVQPK